MQKEAQIIRIDDEGKNTRPRKDSTIVESLRGLVFLPRLNEHMYSFFNY
jgi:hypothetical protein